jgi:hypothetical protein
MSVPPATQKPWTLQSTGFSEVKRLMKPRTFRHIIWKSTTGSQTRSGSWFAAWTAGSSGEEPPPAASSASRPGAAGFDAACRVFNPSANSTRS